MRPSHPPQSIPPLLPQEDLDSGSGGGLEGAAAGPEPGLLGRSRAAAAAAEPLQGVQIPGGQVPGQGREAAVGGDCGGHGT